MERLNDFYLPKLRILTFSNFEDIKDEASIGDIGIKTLFSSDWSGLHRLSLRMTEDHYLASNDISDEGIRWLTRAHFPQLYELRLRNLNQMQHETKLIGRVLD